VANGEVGWPGVKSIKAERGESSATYGQVEESVKSDGIEERRREGKLGAKEK
jgi:hypothetical protein